MRRATRRRQKLTNKPTVLIVATSALSIALCSFLLWINLNNSTTESKASNDDLPIPALDFEVEDFVAIDSINLRTTNYREAKPLKTRSSNSDHE